MEVLAATAELAGESLDEAAQLKRPHEEEGLDESTIETKKQKLEEELVGIKLLQIAQSFPNILFSFVVIFS